MTLPPSGRINIVVQYSDRNKNATLETDDFLEQEMDATASARYISYV